MSDWSDLQLPANFSGVVKLFPLPNLVLFPGVVQALHIFEPRYREMMRDTLAGDETIAMCLIRSDSEKSLQDPNPEIYEHVCVGKLIAHTELADGRFNLLLQGVKRARILRELPTSKPYRLADVEIIEDESVDEPAVEEHLREKVIETCKNVVSNEILDEATQTHVLKQLPLGFLIDFVAFSTQLDGNQRQEILEIASIHKRARKADSDSEDALEPMTLVLFRPVSARTNTDKP